MKITFISLFPKLHEVFLSQSIIARAIEKGILSVQVINVFDFCAPGQRVDANAVGHGSGMVLKPEIINHAIDSAKERFGPGFTIFFTPQGRLLDQDLMGYLADFFGQEHEKCLPDSVEVCSQVRNGQNGSTGFSACQRKHLILVCSRYEGPDQRVVDLRADLELSVGNYVLMGGDLPAQVFVEALLRLVPEVVGDCESVQNDSFQGCLFDYPSFCQPKEWQGESIPEVLLSGNHREIQRWRMETSARNTVLKNFQWLRSHKQAVSGQFELTAKSGKKSIQTIKQLVKSIIPKHFVCLMHTDVIVEGVSGTTSVTSIDIQDIARSCATFGVDQFFVVTPLVDQTIITRQFLDFWCSESGQKLNGTRYEAVKNIAIKESIEKVLEEIYIQTGQSPILIATSAKSRVDNQKFISFNDQEKIWSQGRSVLLILGSGGGLTDRIVQMANHIFVPIEGFVQYNHLTVRAAAGIILDRWLGINVKKNDDFLNFDDSI